MAALAHVAISNLGSYVHMQPACCANRFRVADISGVVTAILLIRTYRSRL